MTRTLALAWSAARVPGLGDQAANPGGLGFDDWRGRRTRTCRRRSGSAIRATASAPMKRATRSGGRSTAIRCSRTPCAPAIAARSRTTRRAWAGCSRRPSAEVAACRSLRPGSPSPAAVDELVTVSAGTSATVHGGTGGSRHQQAAERHHGRGRPPRATAVILVAGGRRRPASWALPKIKWVYLHGCAGRRGPLASAADRQNFHSSPAMVRPGRRSVALEMAGVGLDDLSFIDLYSCFPVAVEIGAAELGLTLDIRGVSPSPVISGAGGPWEQLTAHSPPMAAGAAVPSPASFRLVMANGWPDRVDGDLFHQCRPAPLRWQVSRIPVHCTARSMPCCILPVYRKRRRLPPLGKIDRPIPPSTVRREKPPMLGLSSADAEAACLRGQYRLTTRDITKVGFPEQAAAGVPTDAFRPPMARPTSSLPD